MESSAISNLGLSNVKNLSLNNGVSFEPSTSLKEDCDTEDDFHVEYRNDIWNNLLTQEADKMLIHLQSPQLEYRGALVCQLRSVCNKLSLGIGTLHSAVTLLDLFMDAHRLRSDRLSYVALACLSLAAKSEERFSKAPTIKTLSRVTGNKLCSTTFRQLEWMIGEHVKWRLLMPTPATYAALLAGFIVTDEDLNTKDPKLIRKFKRDGQRLLEAYLDLTLSDVRLRCVESVCVACACVCCARVSAGLSLSNTALGDTLRPHGHTVELLAGLLLRMMQVRKSKESSNTEEVDQGYGSAKTTPMQTPCASPMCQPSPSNNLSHPVLDLNDSAPTSSFCLNPELTPPKYSKYYVVNSNDPNDYSFYRSHKLLEASMGGAPVRMAVKRSALDNSRIEMDNKRVCLVDRMSQVTL